MITDNRPPRHSAGESEPTAAGSAAGTASRRSTSSPLPDPTAERCFRLCDVTIRLVSNHPAVAERIFALMEYFGVDPLEEPAATSDLSLELVCGGADGSLPARELRPVANMGIGVAAVDGKLHLDDGASWIRLDCDRGTAAGSVDVPPGGAPRFNLNLVTYALLTLLRFRGLYPLHAAGVTLDGVGCLLIGDSGSGKSTLAVSLLREGWGLLSDDSLLLRGGAAGVEAMPLRRDLFLEVGNGLSPEVAGAWESYHLAEPAKKRLKVREAYPERSVLTCTPRFLLFPRVTGAPESRLLPCSRADSLHLLAHQSLVAEMERLMAPSHLAALKDLVNQCESYTLLAGADLLNSSRAAARLIGRILHDRTPSRSCQP